MSGSTFSSGKSQTPNFAYVNSACSAHVKYKCEDLALWLEGFFWQVHGVFHV